MRKETILNYEKEFLAWCKGESILLGAPASMHEKPLVWREVRDFNDWKPLDTVYVLNDSYSTYRKALAEGKSIQMLCRYDKMEPIWDDMTEVIKSIGFVDVKENYRIKPEEPKFKVGDWVRNRINEIGQILQEDYKGKGLYKISNTHALKCEVGTSAKDLTIWAPKKGDWCWFWVDGQDCPDLRKLNKTDKHTSPYITIPIGRYKFCEPFIGNLPTLSNK